jgi:hypothetical protein
MSEKNPTPAKEASPIWKEGPGRGGFRPGGGRKPDGYISKQGSDVAYARTLVRTLMRDEAQPMALRARCALAVLGFAARSVGKCRKLLPESG